MRDRYHAIANADPNDVGITRFSLAMMHPYLHLYVCLCLYTCLSS